ncbi:MAG: DUF4197 domain-containing protein [Bacteroidales bacterium]|nr:DUF4197 domain-containing protein [Bacteroidales bacterium]
MKKICLSVIAVVLFASCDDMFQGDGDLSSSDIVKGLKTALNVGTDSSTAMLSVANGYYGDAAVKILLPQEAQYIQEKARLIDNFWPGTSDVIDAKLEQLIESINRSAEDAAKDAKPIFSQAITDLSIVDGLRILNGEVPDGDGDLKSSTGFDSLAATTYLKVKTYDALVGAYAPKVNAALGKKLVGNASAASLWSDIVGRWNGIFQKCENNKNSTVVKIALVAMGKSYDDLNLHEVNTDLGEFTTQKALDGLFLKVGDQEKAIRKNPFQWASDILRKVFGSVYESVTD